MQREWGGKELWTPNYDRQMTSELEVVSGRSTSF